MTYPDEDTIIERRRFLDESDRHEFSVEEMREEDERGISHLRNAPGPQETP